MKRRQALTSMMLQYENGQLMPEETISMFQRLIDSGIAWEMSPMYAKTAERFIAEGLCTPRKDAA